MSDMTTTDPLIPAPGTAVSDQPTADLSRAPLPTAATLRRRRSLPFQLTRFAVFNTRIMRMVAKGGH